MLQFKYFICSILYYIGFLVFGWYIHLVEWTDILSCFLFKYVNPVEPAYDYVIVGAGSAGSVVALRLAENKNYSVLLLEAGPRNGYFLDIPAIAPMMQLSSVDWQYSTVPQDHACKAFKNNVCFWPMGRMVGGTNQFNSLIYTRGHPNDYENWYEDLEGFSYERDILYYFKKMVNYKGTTKDDYYHSRGGPYRVEEVRRPTAVRDIFLRAVEELGYPVRDTNINNNLGFMPVQANIKEGRRWTTSHELLARRQHNLRLITNAHAEKILLKNKYEAQAVKYTHLGEKYIVKARKGIILSAGTVGTPKLLMLSGIGPNDHLKKLGISPKIDLPVGNNLQDHITTGYDLVVFNRTVDFTFLHMCSLFTICDYFFNGNGTWTIGGAEAVGLINSNNSTVDVPDLEFMELPSGISVEGGHHILKSTNIIENFYRQYFLPLYRKSVATILPIVLHPKSRGTVRLKDKNPRSKPVINPNYLSNPFDIEQLLKGIDLIKKMLSTTAFVQAGAKLYDKPFPGCDHLLFDTKEYWICYVKHLTLTSFHPVGTCKMGKVDNKNSVVDFNHKVIGTNNLYIVDGSILPTLPSGNPNAAIIMLAEKMADIIKYHDFLNTGFCTVLEILVVENVCKFL